MRERRDRADWAVVAVEDAGVGIAAADTARPFDAFYTTKPSGLGMGLSISRSIIERHGGRLWATRNPQHGATFAFALPGMAPSIERSGTNASMPQDSVASGGA